MRSMPPPPAPPANSQFGKYTLVERIAVGGMAEVFLALEPRPAGEPRSVVVKRMLPSIAAEPGARDMFLAESRLGKLIAHPNVVEVIGVGEEGEQPYLVLEYVRGLDLWQLMRWMMREGKTFDIPLALYILKELLQGLQAVHGATDETGAPLQVIHRDVSPSNILLSTFGEIKLGDFGIAWSGIRDTLGPAVQGERAKGKLGYLSPEQVKGETCDQRADIFSVGVIAAELLMGRPLFSGGSELAVLLSIRDAKIHPFLEFIPRLPKGLGEVVAEALAANPNDRLEDTEEVAKGLAPFQTESTEVLQKRLTELVMGALTDAPLAENSVRGEFADRITSVDLIDDRHTPGAPLPVGTAPPPRGSASTSTAPPPNPMEETIEVDPPVFDLQTPTGERLPSQPYAQVIEGIATGRIAPDTLVRKGEADFRPIEADEELKRHLPATRFTPTTRQHRTPSDPDRTLDLANGGFTTAMTTSVLHKESGFWLCEFGGVRKEVYLTDGQPRFVTSNLAGELLGEYLVSRGVISRGELDMALAVMPRFEGRLGDTLTALGLVEPVHLFQIIASQVRDKLVDLFMWNGGTASLYLGVKPPESAFPLKIDPWRIIEEGIRRRVEEGLEAARFEGRAKDALARAATVPDAVQRAPLPPDTRLLLNTLVKPRTYGELLEMLPDLPGRKNRAARSVVLLLHLKAIRWAS
ncbi:MAG: protein kinase [Myxococcales bacterium]|nr:protein kinase [Myxococcales bacterium]